MTNETVYAIIIIRYTYMEGVFMNWIDIVFIAIIAISAIVGLAKGLFESILSLFGTALSLFVAIYASKPFAEFIAKFVDLNSILTNLLVGDGKLIPTTGLDILTLHYSPEQVVEYATILASILVMFILIKLVIWLLARLFDGATKNSSALSGLNRLLGFVFGIAKGGLFVAIALAATSLVSTFAFGSQIQDAINQTTITSKVYSYVDEFTQNQLEDKIREWLGDGTETEGETTEEPVTATIPMDAEATIIVPSQF